MKAEDIFGRIGEVAGTALIVLLTLALAALFWVFPVLVWRDNTWAGIFLAVVVGLLELALASFAVAIWLEQRRLKQ